MKTLVIANQKGGVGKSAVARLLAHYLVRNGKRVLALDLDHQANLSAPLKLSGKAAVATFNASQIFIGQSGVLPVADLVLVPGDSDGLLGLERQGDKHNDFAKALRGFLREQVGKFDACIIDTNPNPDIRLICALVSANYVLSPIQLNQEAIAGIVGLVNHPRVGIQRFKRKELNPALELIGILPTLVEPTPFQKENFAQLSAQFANLLIRQSDGKGFAFIPKRSIIAEAQASGAVLWEMKKSSARDTWKEIEPTLRTIATCMQLEGNDHGA